MSTHTPKSLTLIVAATSTNLGIGLNGTLPWRLKTDMSFFASTTKHTTSPSLRNAVIMGRKTFLSIPPRFRPLPGRLNLVLSRTPETLVLPEGVLRAGSIAEAVRQVEEMDDVERVFVIGGAEVYKAALEWGGVEKIILTRVENQVECDAFFPVRVEEEEGWKRVNHKGLEGFVGGEVPEGVVEEGAWRYGFELWQKR